MTDVSDPEAARTLVAVGHLLALVMRHDGGQQALLHVFLVHLLDILRAMSINMQCGMRTCWEL